MQLRQLRTLESLQRVQAFLDDHATAIGAAAPHTPRARLDAAVDELAAHHLERELALSLARWRDRQALRPSSRHVLPAHATNRQDRRRLGPTTRAPNNGHEPRP